MQRIYILLCVLFCVNIFCTSDFHFAILSDRSGGVNHEAFQQVVKEIVLLHPDIILTVGDLADDALESQYKLAMEVMNQVEIPVYYTPGNNDITDASSAELFTKYTGKSPYYSFDYQNTHFIILDNSVAESYAEINSLQKKWLITDLEKSANSDNIIVFMHKPFWADGIGEGKKDEMHELFVRNEVRAVFTGHWHQYAYNNFDGIDYYLVGSSGGGFGTPDDSLGKFYQFLWCKVDDDKLSTAIVKTGNLFEKELVNIYEEKMSYRIEDSLIQSAGKLKDNKAEIEITIINETDKDLNEKLIVRSEKNWEMTFSEIQLSIPAGQQYKSTISLKKIGSLYPIPEMEFSYPFGRNKVINYKKPLNISPVFSTTLMTKSPEIDGKILKKEYKNSVSFADFYKIDGNLSDIDKTEIYVLIDSEYLYLTTIAMESDMNRITSAAVERDGNVYDDDNISFLISQNKKDIYQMFINTIGTIWDMKINRNNGIYEIEWDSEVEAVVQKQKESFIVELRIPLSDLSFEPGKPVLLNAKRNQKTKNATGSLIADWSLNTDKYIIIEID